MKSWFGGSYSESGSPNGFGYSLFGINILSPNFLNRIILKNPWKMIWKGKNDEKWFFSSHAVILWARLLEDLGKQKKIYSPGCLQLLENLVSGGLYGNRYTNITQFTLIFVFSPSSSKLYILTYTWYMRPRQMSKSDWN